ncbi:hypothetical protein STFE110948_01895 [Streptobacillus felis]|uniref:Uncharacterized protein n=1 Tax=Streptobacillus felis TaxID=1384509 RepID=A0A7Z0PFL9_9FUSO|nr:hypothetical protein [Streptobacillus felis]NYV27677.1 hypothetical protein [Streptobacillus felis]
MQKCCINCGKEEFILKKLNLPVKDVKDENDFTKKFFNLLKNECYYLRVCVCCGKTELYNAAIVEKNYEKNNCKCCK